MKVPLLFPKPTEYGGLLQKTGLENTTKIDTAICFFTVHEIHCERRKKELKSDDKRKKKIKHGQKKMENHYI